MLPNSVIYKVSSLDLDNDVKQIRELMRDLGNVAHSNKMEENNYTLSGEAVYGMGWYFYGLAVSRDFLFKLIDLHGDYILHFSGNSISEKFGNWLMKKLEERNCHAKIKLASKKEFRFLWPWLLK